MKHLTFFLFFFTALFSVEKYRSDQSKDFVFKADLNRRLSHFIPYKDKNLIGYHRIDSAGQFSYVKINQALKKFRKKRVDCVALEINGSKGNFFYALQIANLMEEMDREYRIPIITIIRPEALGSMAVLPYASRFMGTVKKGVLGTEEGETILLDEQAGKVIGKIADSFGRDPLVAEGMVDHNLFLVLRRGVVVSIPDGEELLSGDIVLSEKGQRLTLTAEQMINLGISDFAIPDDEDVENILFEEPYFARMPGVELVEYKGTLFYILNFFLYSICSALLFYLLILGSLITFTSMRFRSFTFWAIVSLLLILTTSFYAYSINWFEVAAFVLGLALLTIETVFLAGFGLTGIIGAFLALVGVFALFMPQLDLINYTDFSVVLVALFPMIVRFTFLLLAFVAALITLIYLCKKNPESNLLRKKWLERGEAAGFVKGLFSGKLPPVGSRAIVYTSLRPIGTIRVGKDVVEAICESKFIEAGQPVNVVAHEEGRAKVKEIELTEV